ncbi:MAG: hypothetical protein EXS15_05250 [Phycisphaerales bacterium]|nr:hypothetical protein [Phycisphaerales bacterium]
MIQQIATQLPPLAATIAPLAGEVIEALRSIAQMGFRAAQLSTTHVGTRPRDLDGSGRRDLIVQLRRLELSCGGLDLWIPSAHFVDPTFVDRAVDAVVQSVSLAAALGRCPVSIALPQQTPENAIRLQEVRDAIDAAAQREGVWIADHSLDASIGTRTPSAMGAIGIGIDPAALIGAGHDVHAVISSCRADIVSARIVDLMRSGMRGPPGEPSEERLDLLMYAADLATIPLRFSPVADARQWTDPRAGLRTTLARWRGEDPT